jgi:hypothetical protein
MLSFGSRHKDPEAKMVTRQEREEAKRKMADDDIGKVKRLRGSKMETLRHDSGQVARNDEDMEDMESK